MSKVIGKVLMKYSELQEVILDFDGGINNILLCYQEESLNLEVLTPRILLRGKLAILLEKDFYTICMTTLSKKMLKTYQGMQETNRQKMD